MIDSLYTKSLHQSLHRRRYYDCFVVSTKTIAPSSICVPSSGKKFSGSLNIDRIVVTIGASYKNTRSIYGESFPLFRLWTNVCTPRGEKPLEKDSPAKQKHGEKWRKSGGKVEEG